MIEKKPVAEIARIALKAVQDNYQRAMNDTLLAALKAEGLNPEDGWQLYPTSNAFWVRTTPDVSEVPSAS